MYFPVRIRYAVIIEDFYKDYDELILLCINTDFAEMPINADIPDTISSLYKGKWEIKSTKLRNELLRQYVFKTLKVLSELENILNPEFVFLLPDGKHLRMLHDTFEDDERNDSIFRPITHQSRLQLRNLYVKLHPEDYEGHPQFENAFHDWLNGEF